MNKIYKRKHENFERIAVERIVILFDEARKIYSYDPTLSDRYAQLAKKISMKIKVPIPAQYKKQICKTCYSFLMPGKSCRVRTQQKRVVYTCLKCGNIMRHPILEARK